MYTVTIIEIATLRPVHTLSIPYGKWKEIGYWLNENEYIDPRYKVEVRFSE